MTASIEATEIVGKSHLRLLICRMALTGVLALGVLGVSGVLGVGASDRATAAPALLVERGQASAAALTELVDASDAGYPALQFDDQGAPVAHWYYEEGTRDHLWHNVFR